VWAYCFVGQRSYYAARALVQYGYDIKSLSGGYMTATMKTAQGS
jgi:rhodanese-related sulfurtransferase